MMLVEKIIIIALQGFSCFAALKEKTERVCQGDSFPIGAMLRRRLYNRLKRIHKVSAEYEYTQNSLLGISFVRCLLSSLLSLLSSVLTSQNGHVNSGKNDGIRTARSTNTIGKSKIGHNQATDQPELKRISLGLRAREISVLHNSPGGYRFCVTVFSYSERTVPVGGGRCWLCEAPSSVISMVA